MDIVAKTVLDFVKTQEGYEHSVIAGGAVRDHLLGLEIKDFDIICPFHDNDHAQRLLASISDHFEIAGMVDRWEDYGGAQGIAAVDHFEFEGKQFDVIFKRQPNDEDFGPEVVAGFDYGLNMAYYDGTSIDQSNPHFKYDFEYRQCTLINIDDLYTLPKSIERFNRWSDKHLKTHGYPLRWSQTCLQLREKEIKRNDNINFGSIARHSFPEATPWDQNMQQVEARTERMVLRDVPPPRPRGDILGTWTGGTVDHTHTINTAATGAHTHNLNAASNQLWTINTTTTRDFDTQDQDFVSENRPLRAADLRAAVRRTEEIAEVTNNIVFDDNF